MAEHYFTIKPHRIGVMIDLPQSPGCSDLFVEGLKLAFNEARAEGIGDRPVELVVREYAAQPWRSAHHNIEAFKDLVENEHVIGIAGPMTTDNALALLPHIEKADVPVISICGSQEFTGDFAFSTPNGGMADEPMVLAAYLHSQGLRNIGLVKETPSQIGEEYAYNLHLATRQYGLSIALEKGVPPTGNLDDPTYGPRKEVEKALEQIRAVNADCLVYFGLGHIAALLNNTVRAMKWSIPCFMGTAFVGASYTQKYVELYDGWTGLDQWHEGNPVFQRVMSLYEQKHGKRLAFPTSVFTCGYDVGRVFALGIDRMRVATGPALRNALETVTRVPAATGAPGTVVSFSKRNHRGFKGADYLILRKSVGGKNILVGTAPII